MPDIVTFAIGCLVVISSVFIGMIFVLIWKDKQSSNFRRKLMADFQVLNANIAQLKTDAEALINLQGSEDPAIQAGIDAAAQQVADIDTEIKAKLGV